MMRRSVLHGGSGLLGESGLSDESALLRVASAPFSSGPLLREFPQRPFLSARPVGITGPRAVAGAFDGR